VLASLAELKPEGLSPVFGHNEEEQTGNCEVLEICHRLILRKPGVELGLNDQNITLVPPAHQIRTTMFLAADLRSK
jgi:hypothetical protein